jgi:group II intron reverse transcriptase/maturase
VGEVVKHLCRGLTNVVEADIVDCFGSIPQGRLMKAVARRITDGAMLGLLKRWLKAGVMEDGVWKETITGTPQGGVISPLLANIYLDAFDQYWRKEGLNAKHGQNAQVIRYADDLVILTDKEAGPVLERLKEVMGRLGLVLHPEKTRIIKAKESHFDFLGFNFRQRKNPKTGRWFCYLQPSQKAQRSVREKLRQAINGDGSRGKPVLRRVM